LSIYFYKYQDKLRAAAKGGQRVNEFRLSLDRLLFQSEQLFLVMTQHNFDEYDVEEPPELATLEQAVLNGDTDIKLIENYCLFQDLGGVPTGAMRARLRLAVNKLKQDHTKDDMSSDPAPPSQPRTSPVAPIETRSEPGSSLATDILTRVLDSAARVAVSIYESKAARDHAAAVAAVTAATKAEYKAAREHEMVQAAAHRAGERRDQLFIWALSTATKFAFEHMKKEKG
jgi:hypothetical protein